MATTLIPTEASDIFIGGVFVLSKCDSEVKIFHVSGDADHDYSDIHLYVVAYIVAYIQDIILDNEPELTVRYGWVTGTAGGESISVVGWDGHDWKYYMSRPASSNLAYVDNVVIAQLDQDTDKEISVFGTTSTGIGGGMGIGRDILLNYDFDRAKNQFQLGSIKKLSSPYRVHVLEDAQAALDAKNWAEAIANYNLAAYNDGLRLADFSDSTIDFERSNALQRSFAFFRMVTLYAFIGDKPRAETYLSVMNAFYPSGKSGGEFTEAAEQFLDVFTQKQDAAAACQTVSENLKKQYPDINYDLELGWGDNNIHYEIEQLCPFGS